MTDQTLNSLLDTARLTRMHWKVWFLSAMGIFLDGFDLFIIGVALPLIKNQADWTTTPFIEGLLGVSALVGSIAGALVAGFLTDRFGRKQFYIADLAFVIIGCILCSLSWNVWSLIVFRFLTGIAVGADYPISASYISEFAPARIRGRMLIGGFSFQALGMLFAALSGLLILKMFSGNTGVAWRSMFALAAIPAAVILVFRLGIPESARWLLENNHKKKAADVVTKFLPAKRSQIRAALKIEQKNIRASHANAEGYRTLFSHRMLKRTVLAAAPWFCMDIATYGIGIFTPLILAQLGSATSGHNIFTTEWVAVEQAAFVDLFLVAGFAVNLFLVEKLGRIKLQAAGFVGMIVGLCTVASTSLMQGGASSNMLFILAGFTIFNLFMNAGPNSTTFMLPVELFPTGIRATAHGFAASAAKTGATVGALLLPILKANPHIGIPGVLLIVAGFCFIGLLVTLVCRVETTGKTLSEMEPWEAVEAMEHSGIKA